MTRLLKPLFYNTSTAATPPADSCSSAPPILTQHASIQPKMSSPTLLQCSPSHTITSAPLVPHRSAPPSLTSSPREHAPVPHACSSSSIPSLPSSSHQPSSIAPLLIDLSTSEPQTQSCYPLMSRSESQLHFQPESQFPSRSHPHSFSQPHLQPLLQPSSMEPLLNLEEVEWGEHAAQLSFIDEGQPSV